MPVEQVRTATAEPGGALAEVSVLFADLQGFTAFSEGVEPHEVAAMLNRYLAVAVPCVLDAGGTVVQFVGDALLAVWGTQPPRLDHATRAVAAALAMDPGRQPDRRPAAGLATVAGRCQHRTGVGGHHRQRGGAGVQRDGGRGERGGPAAATGETGPGGGRGGDPARGG